MRDGIDPRGPSDTKKDRSKSEDGKSGRVERVGARVSWRRQSGGGAGGWCGWLEPAFGPRANRGKGPLKVTPLVGQLVLDPDRGVGMHMPGNDALGFQFLEALRQHPVADVGNGIPDRRESGRPGKERVDDGTGPPPADQFDGAMVSGADGREGLVHEEEYTCRQRT